MLSQGYEILLSPPFLNSVGIMLSPLSVRPLCYLLLNHWKKSNNIWCVRYSHEWGMQSHIFGPVPGASERCKKVKYHYISITKSISKIFTKLCVCSHKKRHKHFKRDFHSVAWVMSQGWDLGCVCLLCYLLLNHWTKSNLIWCVSYSHELGVQ